MFQMKFAVPQQETHHRGAAAAGSLDYEERIDGGENLLQNLVTGMLTVLTTQGKP